MILAFVRKFYSFVFLAVLVSSSAFGQGIVREIELKELLPEDIQSTKKRFSNVMTTGATLAEVDEILRHLFKTNHYDNVEARDVQVKGRNFVQIIGYPVEIIDDVEVTGNDNMDEDDIIEKLEIQVGKRLPKNQILQLIPSVEEAYQKQGYLNAKVKVDFKSLSPEKILVNIRVVEGLPCRVSDITIETSNPILKEKLAKKVRSFVGGKFLSNITNNIREEFMGYFVEERFLNANLLEPELKFSPDKSSVSIRLAVENPYQYLIFYEGNTSIESIRLSKALKLSSTERFGLNPAAELADRLRIYYQKQGYANAKSSFDEQIIARVYIKKLKLKIEEGPRVRIHEIEVAGKISKKSKYYANFIKEHSSDLIDLGYYNLDDLELGYKNLITELQNQGFLQAKLQSARTEFLRKGQYVNIKVFIDEGPQTHIREIRFKGIHAFQEKDLLDVINLTAGSPLSLNTFEASIPKLREFYTAHGYLDMKINENSSNFIRYNELNTLAEIEYDIEEGPLVEVASILIQGNEQTNDDVLLREIDFEPGDKLTSLNINESEFRLQRLGLFSSVAIRTLEKDTPISKRTVIIEVIERNPGLFNIGGSVNNELGDQYGLSFLAYSGIAYRNLLGTARAISLRGEMNYNLDTRFTEYDLTASYLEPFVFNDRIRGRVNFTKSVRIFKSEPERLLALETHQVGTTLERDFGRSVKFTWNLWSLANTRKFAARGNYNSGSGGEEKLSIATIGPQLDWDLRDHPFMPTKGIFFRVTGDYSDPNLGSTQTVNFFKVSSSFNTYLPLGSPKFVWANSVRGGYLKNLSNEPKGRVPEEVMFTLGGRSTIRGFDPQAIPSRNEFLNEINERESDKPMFVQFNSHYYLLKTEFRFPIWGDFGGVIFYDGGAVAIADIKFQDEYRDAAGVGFRYNTPVGPVSAELAYKLDRRESPTKESPFRFHFSIGAF